MWVGILVLTSGALCVTIVHRTRSQGERCRRLFPAGEMVKLSCSGMSKFCLRGYCELFPMLRILGHIPLDVSYNIGCPDMSLFFLSSLNESWENNAKS